MSAQDMIKVLLRLGFSQVYISKQVGMSQPNIHRIAQGQDPKYSHGKRIEEFYLREIGKKAGNKKPA